MTSFWLYFSVYFDHRFFLLLRCVVLPKRRFGKKTFYTPRRDPTSPTKDWWEKVAKTDLKMDQIIIRKISRNHNIILIQFCFFWSRCWRSLDPFGSYFNGGRFLIGFGGRFFEAFSAFRDPKCSFGVGFGGPWEPWAAILKLLGYPLARAASSRRQKAKVSFSVPRFHAIFGPKRDPTKASKTSPEWINKNNQILKAFLAGILVPGGRGLQGRGGDFPQDLSFHTRSHGWT